LCERSPPAPTAHTAAPSAAGPRWSHGHQCPPASTRPASVAHTFPFCGSMSPRFRRLSLRSNEPSAPRPAAAGWIARLSNASRFDTGDVQHSDLPGVQRFCTRRHNAKVIGLLTDRGGVPPICPIARYRTDIRSVVLSPGAYGLLHMRWPRTSQQRQTLLAMRGRRVWLSFGSGPNWFGQNPAH